MANVLTSGSPLILDTVVNNPAAMSALVPGAAIYVHKVQYLPAASGDSFQIVDGNGAERIAAKAAAAEAGGTVEIDFGVDSMGHGRLVLAANPGWYLKALTASGIVKIHYTQP